MRDWSDLIGVDCVAWLKGAGMPPAMHKVESAMNPRGQAVGQVYGREGGKQDGGGGHERLKVEGDEGCYMISPTPNEAKNALDNWGPSNSGKYYFLYRYVWLVRRIWPISRRLSPRDFYKK